MKLDEVVYITLEASEFWAHKGNGKQLPIGVPGVIIGHNQIINDDCTQRVGWKTGWFTSSSNWYREKDLMTKQAYKHHAEELNKLERCLMKGGS